MIIHPFVTDKYSRYKGGRKMRPIMCTYSTRLSHYEYCHTLYGSSDYDYAWNSKNAGDIIVFKSTSISSEGF